MGKKDITYSYVVKIIETEQILLVDNNDYIHPSNGCFPVDIPLKEIHLQFLKVKEPLWGSFIISNIKNTLSTF